MNKYGKPGERTLIQSLIFIRDKGMCAKTHYRAIQEFNCIKYKLDKIIGRAHLYCLYRALLNNDPNYPDGFGDKWNEGKTYLGDKIDEIVCMLVSKKEALKYMKEFKKSNIHYTLPKTNSYYFEIDHMYGK